MLSITQIAGFAGAALAGAAYVPQISHLIRARCSAGISQLAFGVWLLASVLTTARAIAIHAGVFIMLGGIQIVATALIMICAARYKDTTCQIHLPRQPAAMTAPGTGASGDESVSWRPPGRPAAASATPARRGRPPRACVPVRHPRSHAATEFLVTHLKETR
jgi:PQ loop repeat